MTIKKSTLDLTFWFGMSLGSLTAIIFMATCLVYVLIHQDLSFFTFRIHEIHHDLEYATILGQYNYKSKIEPAIIIPIAIFLTGIILIASFSTFKRLRKEAREEKAYLKARSKNTKKKTQRHKEESIALFI